MAEHAVGNLVVLKGTITAIDGDVALVKVDRSFPPGGTVTVRLGKLPDSAEVGKVVIDAIKAFGRKT